MTQKEKIDLLKSTIVFLYEKEGRSISYISRLLEVDRKTLSYQIKNWNLKQANVSYLSPSNQKFANKNKQLIKSRLDNDIPVTKIAEELSVGYDYLLNIIQKTELLEKAFSDFNKRRELKAKENKEKAKEQSSRIYNFENLPDEKWKEILGHENYFISNMGRIKKYTKKYNVFYLLKQEKNLSNGRMYVKINDKNLQVSRLVGFAFVEGYSEINNTIEHKNNNKEDNKAQNLEWLSMSANNQKAYNKGRKPAKAYSRNKKFKKIIIDDKYEFKTIRAFCNFFNISETQGQRYLDGEVKSFKHKIKFVY